MSALGGWLTPELIDIGSGRGCIRYRPVCSVLNDDRFEVCLD